MREYLTLGLRLQLENTFLSHSVGQFASSSRRDDSIFEGHSSSKRWESKLSFLLSCISIIIVVRFTMVINSTATEIVWWFDRTETDTGRTEHRTRRRCWTAIRFQQHCFKFR